MGLRWRTPASCRGRTGAKKLLPPRERNKRKKEETKQEKMDREREATRRRKESADKFRLQRKPVPKRERERVEGGERRRRMKHTETAPHPKYKAAGPRGSGRGRARVEPAWMTNRTDPNRPIGLPEKHTDRRVEGKIARQDDDARATTDDDDGGTRRDDTTADNTEGDNDEGKAGRGLELELEVELDLELGRGHLQSHEKATTIGTVPTPSPTRGDTVVLTVPKAAAKPSKGEHRQRGPANGGYGSNSNDNLRLEPRPASEAAVTLVVRSSQTKPSAETNMDAQERRGVGEQQQEPPTTPKATKVTSVARPSQTEPPEETSITYRRCVRWGLRHKSLHGNNSGNRTKARDRRDTVLI